MDRENYTVEEIEYLTRVLSYVDPLRAGEMAEALIREYPDITAIFESDLYKLADVTGDDGAAHMLRLSIALYRRGILEKFKVKRKLSKEEVKELAVALMLGRTKETLALISFDSKGKLIAYDILSTGSVNGSSLTPRLLIDVIAKRRAAEVIIIHNHLFGDIKPSAEDYSFTRHIRNILEPHGVNLITHYLVAGKSVVAVENKASSKK